MLGRVVRTVALAGLVIAGAGCRVDLAVHLEVAEDGSGTIRIVATADDDVVERAPGLAQDLRFDDLTAAGWSVDGPSVNDEGGITVTLAHTFATAQEATALLTTLNGADGPFQNLALTRNVDGDDVVFELSGVGRVDSGLLAFTDPQLFAAVGATPYVDEIAAANLSPTQAVGITFEAQLPGRAESSSADPDSEELRWVVPLDGSQVQLNATSTLSLGGSDVWSVVATVLLVVLVVWVVVAALFIALVVRARQRRLRARRRPLPPTNGVRPLP